MVQIRRYSSKAVDKLALIVFCTGVTIILLKLESVRRTGATLRCSKDIAQNLKHTNLERTKDMDVKNELKCDLLDLFLSVDESAAIYDRNVLCDGLAKDMDIICRIHLRQIGLEHLENSTCKLEKPGRVPKVVYFVIFGTYTFKFWHYVTIVAAKRYVKPTAVYIIGDQHPLGRWWQQVLKDVPGVRFVYRDLPQTISGQPVRFKHHLSDVVRLQTLLMNGGIYLDADMVMVRDPEPLLDYDITLGMVENGTGMGNAFIAAKRGSSFLREWYEQYKVYKKDEFYWNSLQVPRDMWFKNASRVHMETDRLYRPNWFESDLLFKRSDYPWRNNYAVHVWTNGNPVPKSPEDVRVANSTIAQIFRHVLYGDSRPRLQKTAFDKIHFLA